MLTAYQRCQIEHDRLASLLNQSMIWKDISDEIGIPVKALRAYAVQQGFYQLGSRTRPRFNGEAWEIALKLWKDRLAGKNGLSLEEISRQTGVSRSTIIYRLKRLRLHRILPPPTFWTAEKRELIIKLCHQRQQGYYLSINQLASQAGVSRTHLIRFLKQEGLFRKGGSTRFQWTPEMRAVAIDLYTRRQLGEKIPYSTIAAKVGVCWYTLKRFLEKEGLLQAESSTAYMQQPNSNQNKILESV